MKKSVQLFSMPLLCLFALTACSDGDIAAERELLIGQAAELTAEIDLLRNSIAEMEEIYEAQASAGVAASEPSPVPNTEQDAAQLTRDNIDIREYTDDEMAAMLTLSPNSLKEQINTRADAIAFLDLKFPELWMSGHIWQGANSGIAVLSSGRNVLREISGAAGRSDIVTAVAYLLSDNCEEIGGLYSFMPFGGDGGPGNAINYILLDGSYIIFDPVVGMSGDAASRSFPMLPEAEVPSLSAYIMQIEESPLALELNSIYAIEGGQEIRFTVTDEWAIVDSPDVTPLYVNQGADMTDPANVERLYGHIKAENVSNYRLSSLLGGVTMSVDQADALVGASPDTIKEQVKTAADLLMYMLAARMKLQNGCECRDVGQYQWHWNPPARQVLSENLGNCGRMANLANFLLEDDYDEVGFINHSYAPGEGGGHVYTYLLYENKYYIVDFSGFLFSNYSVASEFNYISLDRLEDFGTRWRECFGGIAAIVAYQSPGTDMPCVWHDDYYYLPDDADFTILYENDISIGTLPYPSSLPDWRAAQ